MERMSHSPGAPGAPGRGLDHKGALSTLVGNSRRARQAAFVEEDEPRACAQRSPRVHPPRASHKLAPPRGHVQLTEEEPGQEKWAARRDHPSLGHPSLRREGLRQPDHQ